MYRIEYVQVDSLGHQGDESNAEVIVYAASKCEYQTWIHKIRSLEDNNAHQSRGRSLAIDDPSEGRDVLPVYMHLW